MDSSSNDMQSSLGGGSIPSPSVDGSTISTSGGANPVVPADASLGGKGLPDAMPVDPANLPLPISGSPVQSQPPAGPVMNTSNPFNPQAVSNSGKASQHSPQIAEDVDLIEKEWVIKAKQIINETRDNPHQQSKELGRFKADYLKARYSKDLKVDG